MDRRTMIASALAAAGTGLAGPAAIARGAGRAAEPGKPAPPTMIPGARYTMSLEPAITMRTPAFDWDYEVQVALPASYAVSPDRRYPVLWLVDGPLMLHLAVGALDTLLLGGHVPELIVVGVGCPSSAGRREYGRRRNIDLAPPGKSMLFDGPGGDYMRDHSPKEGGEGARQAGDKFLAFLIDQVRPALAHTYRMADDHGLMGHSGGGMFAAYALFARPGAFRRFIIGSPSINAADRVIFRMEAAYAASHRDLKADIFFGAGEKEIGVVSTAAWGIVSSPVLMAETLLLRHYPSLKLTTRIFPGRDHTSVIGEVIGDGLQTVWADAI